MIKSMKKLLPLMSVVLFLGCANTKELNERIYEVQKQQLIDSPFESAQYAEVKIERQRRFRHKELPYTFKNKILNQSQADTVIVIEEFDEICFNCPASKMMVLHQDTIYTINREIEKGNKVVQAVHIQPYKTVSLDYDQLSNFHHFLVINKKLKNGVDWKANPTSLGSDNCLGGDYTLATVIYPNGAVESMFVRCWWLGNSVEYLKE